MLIVIPDEQGNLKPEIAEGVDRHQLGVARHQEEIRADGRRMTLGDYNRPDLFYSNRSAIRPPTFERSDFEINPTLYTLVSMHPFHGLSQEHPIDHIELFEDLISRIKAEGVSYDYLPCKLFAYSLAGEASSWLKQLKPGSLTTWKEIKVAFLNNFYNDARFEELRMKISTFSQEAAEAFKAAWIEYLCFIYCLLLDQSLDLTQCSATSCVGRVFYSFFLIFCFLHVHLGLQKHTKTYYCLAGLSDF